MLNEFSTFNTSIGAIIIYAFIIICMLWALRNPDKKFSFYKATKKPRFVMHPGPVRSLIDGDLHYISYWKLVDCYRLDPRTDNIIDYTRDMKGYHKEDNDIWLFPRENGDYIEYLESWLKNKNLQR